MLLDDSHFSGLNKIQETIKDELIKKKVEQQVEKVVVENFVKEESFENDVLKNIKIDQATRNVERDVDTKELAPENIEPTISQKLFNRLYFSISTSTLLGFGDIYPITNISKIFVMMQSISTLILIIL
jgi:23S rRNA maturation-related 3'-5' exoribonuclease YhaM